jgi:head-tail adaptor
MGFRNDYIADLQLEPREVRGPSVQLVPLPRIISRPPAPGQRTAPGAYTRRVTINNPANPTKEVPANAFCDSWASIRGLGGTELDKAQQIAQKSTHVITVPYQPGIPQNGTVTELVGGLTRTFQIEHVEDPDEMRFELRLYCFEINIPVNAV